MLTLFDKIICIFSIADSALFVKLKKIEHVSFKLFYIYGTLFPNKFFDKSQRGRDSEDVYH